MSDSKWFSDVLLINRDPNWYSHAGWDYSNAKSAEESIRAFFSKFTTHSITDMLLCVFENTSMIPSDAVMWRGLKGFQAEENGVPVSYPENECLYRLFWEFHLDPVQIFLDIMREGGVRPWLTLRMNDVHFGADSASFLRDDFFYTAQKNGWMIGSSYGYYGYALDYGKEPVRNRMLRYIREILEKYDMFGLELDFMREIFCFDYLHNENRHAIMNDFIKQVHDMIVEAQEKWGHVIRLMVRMPRCIEDAYSFGFDALFWAKNGWVDAIVPTPRWEVSDDAIPVSAWKKAVGEDVAIFPGVETLHLKFSRTTDEMAKAYSAAWNAQGADGLYFNNHDYATPLHQMVYDLHRETVLKGVRRYIVTYQDIAAKGNPKYKPLPLCVNDNASMQLSIGPVRQTDRFTIFLAFDGENAPLLRLNGLAIGKGNRCLPIIEEQVDDRTPVVLTNENTYSYQVDAFVTEGDLLLELEGNGVLQYLEFRMEAGE